MSQVSNAGTAQLVCPSCQRKYKWKNEFAGRTMKCVCGHVMRAPPAPPIPQASPQASPQAAKPSEPAGASPGDDLYGVMEEAESKGKVTPRDAPRAVAPVRRPALPPTPAGAANPGLSAAGIDPNMLPYGVPRRKGLTQEAPKVDYEPWIFRDLFLPIILIASGVGLSFVEAMYRGGSERPIGLVTTDVIIGMALNLGLMLGGVFLASLGGGVSFFDKWPTTILKLCAVALIPGAVAGLILSGMENSINGSILANFAAVGLYWLIFWILFRLPAQDTTICVMIFWIMRVAAAYGAYRMEAILKDSWI